ncbi:BZ3500_MvSof-1268-A1-R1_Chr3-1g05428 [Microbotryum saponariae]|uniref:BZ3500_MvSof-1268-A1-R1_Chr3-1g05428 protein n=1 Tax=Microbotryum saponariae TaxID=289078 RepID=A0A2X0L2D0_9BASI|nr:BZ3500_MvSof-1268-A1-R1_Chr3-1g05428 [Microbotryum saponariae]SDA04619.1 BZ3501_MvSof-1269-A2-R1_Chr3-1g05099 [Microbotryum saponariae]
MAPRCSRPLDPIPAGVDLLSSAHDPRTRMDRPFLLRANLRLPQSFSRSSGPGGQNVNKLSTKAHLRLCLSPPPPWLPPYLLPTLLDSPSYVSTSPSGLLLSSSNTRSQAQNVELGIKRIKELILEAARVGLKGDTSEEQQERVKALERRERSKMLKVKKQRKDVKGGRRTPKLGFE